MFCVHGLRRKDLDRIAHTEGILEAVVSVELEEVSESLASELVLEERWALPECLPVVGYGLFAQESPGCPVLSLLHR